MDSMIHFSVAASMHVVSCLNVHRNDVVLLQGANVKSREFLTPPNMVLAKVGENLSSYSCINQF